MAVLTVEALHELLLTVGTAVGEDILVGDTLIEEQRDPVTDEVVPIRPPYIVFEPTGETVFYAEDRAYYVSIDVTIDIYTDARRDDLARTVRGMVEGSGSPVSAVKYDYIDAVGLYLASLDTVCCRITDCGEGDDVETYEYYED